MILLIFIYINFSVAFYGSGYETNDGNTCESSNQLTGACTCPANANSAHIGARVLNDSPGPGILHGGLLYFCYPNPTQDFLGAFQMDDPVPGGQGCRYPNPLTSGCTCPAGNSDTSLRIIVDTPSGGIIGSNVHFCGSSGGIYQIVDGGSCFVVNHITGACSCPGGFLSQSFRVIKDNGAGGYVGSDIVACINSIPSVELCPGVLADPSGTQPANAAIQQCINSTPPGGTLEFPVGNFRISSQVVISNPITIRTKGTASALPCGKGTPCMTLLGSFELKSSGGLLMIQNTNNVILDHIIIDGNRASRVNSNAWTLCQGGQNTYGFNMEINQCTSCSFLNSISQNSVCGSGLVWNGPGAQIMNNYFQHNGDHFSTNLWSDGLTLLQADSNNRQTIVTGNIFIDNSDVDFICGGATNALFHSNEISHSSQPSFAGMMLDNFDGSTPGNFVGSIISNNSINCYGCTYGLNLGPKGWYNSPNIIGGNVTQNYITSAIFLLNIDGGGTAQYPMAVYANSFGTVYSVSKCGIVGTQFVVCGNSVLSVLDPHPTSTACLNNCHK